MKSASITPTFHPLRDSAAGETFFVIVTEQQDPLSDGVSEVLDDGTILTGALTDYLQALYAAIFVPQDGNVNGGVGVTCLSRPYIEQRLRDSLAVLRGSPSRDVFVKDFVDEQPFNVPDTKWRINTTSLMAVVNRRARNIDPALLALILLVYGTDELPNKIRQSWNGDFFLPISDGTLTLSPFAYRPTTVVARNIVNMPTYWRWMDIIFPIEQGGYSQASVAAIAAMTALPLSPASLVRTTIQHAAPARPFANVMANLVTTRWLTAQRTDVTIPTHCGAVAQWAQLRFFGYNTAVLLDDIWFQQFYTERMTVFGSGDGEAGPADDKLLRTALTLIVDGRLTNDRYDLTDICVGESLDSERQKLKSPFLTLALEAAKEETQSVDVNEVTADPDNTDLDLFDPEADVPDYSDDDTIAQQSPDTEGSSDNSIEPFGLSPKTDTLSAYLYRRAVHQLCTHLDQKKNVALSPSNAATFRWWCNQWLYIAPTTVTKSLIEKLGLAESLRPFKNGV